MGLIEVCTGGKGKGLQIFENFHGFLIAGGSQIQHMKFQIQLEITFCVHGGIVAGNELFLFFHIFQQLLAQGVVIVQSGDDVFDEKAAPVVQKIDEINQRIENLKSSLEKE